MSYASNMDAYWMPFTANRQFRNKPKLLASAKDMHYVTTDGRRLLDGTAGLWCVNAGHGRRPIIEALQRQAEELDYAPSFQLSHPRAFEAADRVASLLPGDLNHVFFTNSGSESVDTALKIAIAYQRARGQGTKQRLIGRERGYHGVGFGGISVGGIGGNRKVFGSPLAGTDHLPHTHDLEHNAFSRGQPTWGAHLADALENLVALHDASNIAGVIVEPLAGSTGVLVPPQGYLQRLRAICDKHDILLIFDEVITGFGRLGSAFAAEYFGVQPDIVCCAKGINNAATPMGAVIVRDKVHAAFMQGPEEIIELFHGYTCSAHPLAVATCLATLDLYRDEAIFENAASLAPYFEEAAHSLRGLPFVKDIRNLGIVAGIELEPIPGRPGKRAYDLFTACFENGLLIRVTGDIVALSPPLVISKPQIDELFGRLADQLQALASAAAA